MIYFFVFAKTTSLKTVNSQQTMKPVRLARFTDDFSKKAGTHLRQNESSTSSIAKLWLQPNGTYPHIVWKYSFWLLSTCSTFKTKFYGGCGRGLQWLVGNIWQQREATLTILSLKTRKTSSDINMITWLIDHWSV